MVICYKTKHLNRSCSYEYSKWLQNTIRNKMTKKVIQLVMEEEDKKILQERAKLVGLGVGPYLRNMVMKTMNADKLKEVKV